MSLLSAVSLSNLQKTMFTICSTPVVKTSCHLHHKKKKEITQSFSLMMITFQSFSMVENVYATILHNEVLDKEIDIEKHQGVENEKKLKRRLRDRRLEARMNNCQFMLPHSILPLDKFISIYFCFFIKFEIIILTYFHKVTLNHANCQFSNNYRFKILINSFLVLQFLWSICERTYTLRFQWMSIK